MRLHILSDLHLEFGEFTPPPTGADVVVLAGDIHVGRKGLVWIRKTFADRPAIYVLGNHEFYHNAIPALTENLQQESEGSHICVLEKNVLEFGGWTFLGCTLWTDFKLNGDPEAAKAAAEQMMSDFQLIRVSSQFRRLRAEDTTKIFSSSVLWLKDELAKRDPERVVIVTHHAPNPQSSPSFHHGSPLNPAFVSDLGEFIGTSHVPLWIHGHTHHCCDYQIGKTRVLSNQRGYPDSIDKNFIPDLVVETLAMSKISLVDLEVFYRVGVPDAERAHPQRLLLTLVMESDFSVAAKSDSIADTIDYFAVTQRLLKFGYGREWKLIEKLAADIADMILKDFKPQSVCVEVKKFIIPQAKHVSVKLERG